MNKLSAERYSLIDCLMFVIYDRYLELKEDLKIQDDDKEGMEYLRRALRIFADQEFELHEITRDELNAFNLTVKFMPNTIRVEIRLPESYHPRRDTQKIYGD